MNVEHGDLLSWTLTFAMVVLTVALFLAFLRLLRGPTIPDRVVALDLIAAIVVGIIGVHAVATDQALFLHAGMVVALILFLGTVAFARYVEKRTLK